MRQKITNILKAHYRNYFADIILVVICWQHQKNVLSYIHKDIFGGVMASKKFVILSVMFCLLAILFFVLFELSVIKNMTLYLALVYVAYFAGLALLYNSMNLRQSNKRKSANVTLVFSLIIILTSIVLMIYGLASGELDLWWSI